MSLLFFSMASGDREVFTENWFCKVTDCQQGPFGKLHQYQRHWKKYHVASLKVFPCIACPEICNRKLELKKHLIKKHNYTIRSAVFQIANTNSRMLNNERYINPGNVVPPVNSLVEEITEEITETVEYVQFGEGVPRDMEYELEIVDGQCHMKLVPKKDFDI